MRSHLCTGLIMLLVSSACRYSEVKHREPRVNEITAGKKFRITLPENHDKKEMWTIADGYDRNVAIRLNDVWHGNEKGIDFNFSAGAAGSTTLTFVKRKYQDTTEVVNYLVKITDY